MFWMIVVLEQGSMTGMLRLNEAASASEAWVAARELAAELPSGADVVLREFGHTDVFLQFDVRQLTCEGSVRLH